jgi:secreted trypsin-like serine protease
LVRKVGGYWQQVGVVSFGSPDCTEGAPDGFTQLNLFLDWIAEETGIVPVP